MSGKGPLQLDAKFVRMRSNFEKAEEKSMPLYEYFCPGCKTDLELLVRFDETPVCPHCSGKKLQKQLSVPAAHVASSGQPSACEAAQDGACGTGQCGMGGCPMF